MNTNKSVVVILLLFMPLIAFAHPGRTDSSGCHTCRTNCPSWGLDTGEYHCHSAKAIPQPEAPIKSTYGANGTGYTTPAPEYSVPKQKTVTSVKPEVQSTTVATTTKPIPSPYQQSVPKPVENRSWFTNLFSWFN
jgi:hypothetical protein